MNHPKHEEWVPFLFGEASPDARHELKEHLRNCAECRAEIEGWKRSLGLLNAWKLPPTVKPAQALGAFFKWAVAAGIVLAVGFGFGRLTSTAADVQRMRAALEPELRQQLRQEMAQVIGEQLAKATPASLAAADKQIDQLLTAFAQKFEARRTEDNQVLYAALAKLASQHDTDFLLLKKELDTVAVNTDAGLRDTEQQIVQLADYAQPAYSFNSPKK